MIVVQHALGLRPGEVCKLRTADVDVQHGTLVTPHDGKTGERFCYFDVNGKAAGALARWTTHGGEYVFGRDRALLVDSYGDAITRACVKAGIPRVKPYTFRHTYACELMDGGSPIATISEALGHKSVLTTARYYLHGNPNMLRRVNAGR